MDSMCNICSYTSQGQRYKSHQSSHCGCQPAHGQGQEENPASTQRAAAVKSRSLPRCLSVCAGGMPDERALCGNLISHLCLQGDAEGVSNC